MPWMEPTAQRRDEMDINPRTDALVTARMRVVEEQAAVALCRSKGWASDLRFAERELSHQQALVARLEAVR